MRLLTGILLVAFGLSALTKAEDNVQALRAVVEAINQFSFSMFHTMLEKDGGNFVVSPLSVAIPLAMAGYGARGETERQLRNVLRMPSPDSFGTSGYQALIDSLNNAQENKLVVATKLFAEKSVDVKPSYKELIETYFRSATQFFKIADLLETVRTHVKWLEEVLRSLSDENTSKLPAGFYTTVNWLDKWSLFSVVSVKAVWKDKFRVQNTTNMPFYVTKDKVIQVPMMTRTGIYRVGIIEELDAQFILIPYKGDELNMVILLPNEIDSLVEMKRKMQNISLSTILQGGVQREVRLSLPKFEQEVQIIIDSVLMEMGLFDAFTSQANFSGVTDDHLRIRPIDQYIKIHINEEGYNAAAVTDEVVETDSAVIEPSTPVLKVDHPFIFSIVKSFRNLEDSSVDSIIMLTGYVRNN